MQNQDTAEGPVARTISVIGSSWTCLILRDFFLHGPRRFQQLQDSLKGIHLAPDEFDFAFRKNHVQVHASR